MNIPSFDEKYLSQIPALEQLINLGFEYLTPEEALAARQGKAGNPLLEEILRKQLKDINRIPYKGNEYRFSEENLQLAAQRLKNVGYDGIRQTNEAIYERLTLGLALGQIVEGDIKSFTSRYIDWHDWRKNTFHVTPEFTVTYRRSTRITRLHIVLFVNGIPFVVIECMPPSAPIGEAVLRLVGCQRGTHPPALLGCAQLLIAINRDTARFGTIGTPARFWSVWKEPNDADTRGALMESTRRVSTPRIEELLFSGDFAPSREFFAEAGEEREISGQAEAIYGLCHPKRLLELIYKFTVFDNGVKKIARYQQYFAIKRILSHIHASKAGRRRGGIVWHTQGSGKSLTMVMLARSLAEEPGISSPRIVLVTDRKDLDKQIKDTFAACDMASRRTKTGRDLLELVSERKTGVITTLVHKFDKALNIRKYQDDSMDIFMLIDESHRTQFGSFAARMRQMFPNACYLGFTGTPLMKKEKNNFARFGGLIDYYTIHQAMGDQAVVPLLYEARHVEMRPDEQAIDSWFECHARGLTDTQKATLKKKYVRPAWLNKTEKVLYSRALDISRHFRNTLQGAGYKGQLVAPDKISALAYHRYLDEIGLVSSEVIISAPGNRNQGETSRIDLPVESRGGDPEGHVTEFWRKMMKRYGSEEEYNNRIIDHFKYGDDPEILIVVDKLQTGFDAPRNAVLYITRTLRGHTLLQTIARVNRLHENEDGRSKEFGLIVDYVGILGNLDKALSQYNALEDFDEEDLVGTLAPIQEELKKLPQRHAGLRELFMNVRRDEEMREMLLRDRAIRSAFLERLAEFGKTLELALSNDGFISDTSAHERGMYEDDLRRFRELEKTIGPRHRVGAEIDYQGIDYYDHEPRIKEMLNTHVSASEATQLNNPPAYISPFDILNENPFCQVKQSQRVYGGKKATIAKANAIAKVARKLLAEQKEWEPAFYGKFSGLIRQAVDDFKARRLSDVEYLERITGIYANLEKRRIREVPINLRGNENATAFHRILKPYFAPPREEVGIYMLQTDNAAFHESTAASNAAIAIDDIFRRHWKVRFWDDADAIKQVMNEIDDYLYDEIKATQEIELSSDQMDEIIEKIIEIARCRMPSSRR
uniref:Type I restriction enzyme endonuclease subunit n=1 Tax=Candidatus Kentrum sp. TC TaxID=2126339 RepID=A0A450YP22_9GAMM|nr:MAG: type I restriction enzyme, R subunit [Candidatus Kentron sp. TC]